jgi:hypothetical protein
MIFRRRQLLAEQKAEYRLDGARHQKEERS